MIVQPGLTLCPPEWEGPAAPWLSCAGRAGNVKWASVCRIDMDPHGDQRTTLAHNWPGVKRDDHCCQWISFYSDRCVHHISYSRRFGMICWDNGSYFWCMWFDFGQCDDYIYPPSYNVCLSMNLRSHFATLCCGLIVLAAPKWKVWYCTESRQAWHESNSFVAFIAP